MTERETFYDAICQNPHDVETRLVFADYLTEHDEEDLAELIRLQIWQTNNPIGFNDCVESRRVSELHEKHIDKWQDGKCDKCVNGWVRDKEKEGLILCPRKKCVYCNGTSNLLMYRIREARDSEEILYRKPKFWNGFLDSVECTRWEFVERDVIHSVTGERSKAYVPSLSLMELVKKFPIRKIYIIDWDDPRASMDIENENIQFVISYHYRGHYMGPFESLDQDFKSHNEAIEAFAFTVGNYVHDFVYNKNWKTL